MNNKNSNNEKKSHSQFDENNISNYPIDSGLLNIPIMPGTDGLFKNPNIYMLNVPSVDNTPKDDIIIKKNNLRKDK